MADDTYAEELYVEDFDVYDYDDDLWNELLETIELEATIEREREESGEYDAEWYGAEEESEETDEADDWEWFDRE